MRFELVRERLRALPRELPAPPAILMPIRVDAPDEPRLFDPTSQVRQAAVLVLLFPDEAGDARVLLTARVPHLSSHAGEVSFPGGSAEPEDRDPIETALREAAEEVALDATACGAVVVGSLERVFIPVSGFRITPVVAVAERRPELRPAPDEVARIIDPPVEAFLLDAPVELEERVIRERLIRYGVYPVAGERVWGATARMLGQLGALLATGVVAGSGGERAAGSGGERAAVSGGVPLERPERTATLPPVEIRMAGAADRAAVASFRQELAPELARSVPAADLLLAYAGDRLVGLASWAPWDRERPPAERRGFEGLDLPQEERVAELTMLAVAPHVRGVGIGRRLTESVAESAARAGNRLLLAWTLADAAIHPSSRASRAFFRSNGFVDLAVDRHVLARGEDRLLLSRDLSA